MANHVHLRLFISRLIAPIAAKQGAQSRLKIRKLKPLAAVNAAASAAHVEPSPPYRTPIVPTMFSLATRPVTDATAACQLPQPSGMNSHATALPSFARMLRLISSSSSIPNAPSAQPKRLRNQITMVESRIIVPAFLMKLQPRSHMLRRTFESVGQW